MYTLFISDLHLNPQQPAVTEIFIQFLQTSARKAAALYILGDLFEMWIGDDDSDAQSLKIIIALRELSDAGVALYFMHGNRDFLIGKKFARVTGCQLLADPTVIDLYGEPTLLMHGDLLCTDDKEYLKFRHWTHKPFVQKIFLTLPLLLRRYIANKLRQKSHTHVQEISPTIMDVTINGIYHYLHHYQVTQMIHGHTHRPGFHLLKFNTMYAQRIILSDWDERGSVLACYENHSKILASLSTFIS